ncbi:MAG: hypothetical protein Q4G36_03315 [Paracoccus sp. (in: a-proteobacteria)]|nr:hypothetical protein [Paracoccus sp. (in: a-proteobacteria)]
MNFPTIGDLARVLAIREGNSSLKSTITRLSHEVSTGRVQDVARHLSGDLIHLSSLEAQISAAQTYRQAAAETASVADAMQNVLGQLQDMVTGTATIWLSETTLGASSTRLTAAEQARGMLYTAVQSLNGAVGGRFLFAGEAFDKPPLPSASAFMAMIDDLTAGLDSADDAIEAINNWFAGGPDEDSYLGQAYSGSLAPPSAVAIDGSTRVTLAPDAASDGIRELLRGLAIATVAANDAFASNGTAQRDLLAAAGNGLLEANSGLVSMRSGLGQAQRGIELSMARNAALTTVLTIERNGLVEADSYDAASKLVQAEAQLEALYVLTRKMAGLSLVRHL